MASSPRDAAPPAPVGTGNSARTLLPGLPVRTVPIGSLAVTGSLRLVGVNDDHVRALAAVDGVLPPILVHRHSNRVIDGVHRVLAAVLRGEDTITAQLIDGTDSELLVVALQVNGNHGLPLTIADRKAAALNIVCHYPNWSDRAVARVAGISDKTVGAIRRCSGLVAMRVLVRIGLDGRSRPVNREEGRRRAAEALRDNPNASLREIARASGVSPETVRKVRARLRDGEARAIAAPHDDRSGMAIGNAIRGLSHDPGLRSTENGRRLLRLLHLHFISPQDRDSLVDSIPPHAVAMVTEVVRACVVVWQELAAQLEGRRFEARPTAAVPNLDG